MTINLEMNVIWCISIVNINPVDTRHNGNIIITSKRRRSVAVST